MPEMTDAYEWSGRKLIDSEGEEIGTIDAIYRDKDDDAPRWAAVQTGLLGRTLTFVPVDQARPSGEDVVVTVSSSQIEGAPTIEPGDELSPEAEAELLKHYGMQ